MASKTVDYKAVSVLALRSALDAAASALASLPDEGGLEPDVVKGARGMLLGVSDNLNAALVKAEG